MQTLKHWLWYYFCWCFSSNKAPMSNIALIHTLISYRWLAAWALLWQNLAKIDKKLAKSQFHYQSSHVSSCCFYYESKCWLTAQLLGMNNRIFGLKLKIFNLWIVQPQKRKKNKNVMLIWKEITDPHSSEYPLFNRWIWSLSLYLVVTTPLVAPLYFLSSYRQSEGMWWMCFI